MTTHATVFAVAGSYTGGGAALTDSLLDRSRHRLSWLVWSYFFLLLFEGSVRKWIPPLSNVFLIIRDPIALGIWYTGLKLGIGSKRVWSIFHVFALTITILGLLQLITTSLPLAVTAYGWRSYVLHVPVAIVLGSYLGFDSLRTLGKWTLTICPFMTLLMAAQYLSPAAAWINMGTGDGGTQIAGALNHIRPAGTFSYNWGPGAFYPFALAMVFWGISRKNLFPQWLVLLSAACILVTIPISVSRTLAITCGAVVCMSALAFITRHGIAFNPQILPKLAGGLIAFVVLSVGLYQIPLVADAVNTFTVRWTSAQGDAQDNSALEERSAGILLESLNPLTDDRLLGRGIGAGSAVGASLANTASMQFGEGSLGREIYELGPPVGSLFLLARFSLSIWIFIASFWAAVRGNLLPSFLAVPATISVCIGMLDIASAQGFIAVLAGISIASLRISDTDGNSTPTGDASA